MDPTVGSCLGPYGGRVLGGGRFLMSEVPLFPHEYGQPPPWEPAVGLLGYHAQETAHPPRTLLGP